MEFRYKGPLHGHEANVLESRRPPEGAGVTQSSSRRNSEVLDLLQVRNGISLSRAFPQT